MRVNPELDRCRAEIRKYQAEYAALPPGEQEQVRELHQLGLSDWIKEECLILLDLSH